MTDEQLNRRRDALWSATSRYLDELRGVADDMIKIGRANAAGLALVCERVVFLNVNELVCKMVPDAPPVPVAPLVPPPPAKRSAAGKRAAKGQGEHRHKFSAAGTCECGAKRQRAPKGGSSSVPAPAARETPEQRTAPIPFTGFGRGVPPLPDGADEFEGGTFGSSSVTERR